jgi:hypothetical protein
MPTEFSFSLSLTAMDILTDLLRLGSPVLIFEVPSVGETMEDRTLIRDVVLRDLASRNLANRGRLEPEVEDALVTLAKYRHAIDGVAAMADESRLCYRAATDGRIAVLARKEDTEIRFEMLRPESLVHAAMGPIGNVKPGPGQSMTYPEASQQPPRQPAHRRQEPEEGFGGLRKVSPAQASGYELQRRAAGTITDKPRTQIGWFSIYGRDQMGRHQKAPDVTWFDTEEGRYMGYRRPGSDGQQWTTYSPSDTPRIAQQVIAMLNSLNQNQQRPR